MNFAARYFSRIVWPAPTRALLLTLCVAALCAAPAAAQSPTLHSPSVPTPYSWPGFHAGGASPVQITNPSPGYAGTLTPATPPTALVPDALFGMLQGTPTGLVAGPYDAEIPSFLLGNYDPANPPGASATVFPSHFGDDIFSVPNTVTALYAPFASLNQTLLAQSSVTGGAVTVDDQNGTPNFVTVNSVLTAANGTAYSTFTWANGLADGTAIDGSATQSGATYSRVSVAADANGDPIAYVLNQNGTKKYPADHFATAVWTLTAAAAGSYTVSFNLPNPVDNSTASTSPNKPEYRIRDAHYVIRDNTGRLLADTRISQQETNSPQFLAGPFPLNSGQQIMVTLDNSTLQTSVPNTYVLADSMTLTPAGGGGDVQSSPAAINASEYPEIANALYYGYAVDTTVTPNVITNATIPTGNPTIGTANPTLNRRIRQVVYFGRSESIVSQRADGSLTAQPVGAIYAIDGNTGSVIWRYQTGGASTTQSTGFLATGLNGVVKSVSLAGPHPFQIGPAAYATTAETGAPIEGSTALATAPGRFGSYTAYSATAPQLSGADLSKYGFSLYATTVTPVDATHVTYSGTFRIYADGYGYTADGPITQTAGLQILEHGTFSITAAFTDPYNANLTGTLTADPGPLKPAGWPQPVDFGAFGAAAFTGHFQSDASGNQSISNAALRAGVTSTTNPPGGTVFSTPAIARIHVLVGGTPAVPLYATKLVVIAADNLGYVYCLDAIGNRDGTSNSNVVDPFLNQPIYVPQPVFGAVAPPSVTDTGYTPHVGTTHQYWVYRPDPTKPKYVTGTMAGKVKTPDPTSDLPVPGAFGLASPTVDIVTRLLPALSGADTTELPATMGATTGTAPDGVHDVNSAFVYIGNTNGTLYKLNTLGTPLDNTLGDGTVAAVPGDTFNASRDIRAAATDPVVPTPKALWWLPVNQAVTGGEEGTDEITSAPAVRVFDDPTGTAHNTTTEIYFTTANDTNNSGRLYRVNGSGPVNSAGTIITPVGGPNYNTLAQAQWSFPNVYQKVNNAAKPVRPALGSIGGSPVLFTNPTGNLTNVYIAANDRQEVGDSALLNVGDAGRIWSVDTNGNANWAYPDTFDPNAVNPTTTKNGNTAAASPIGGFQNATPAVGIVQFPATIEYTTAGNNYTHADAIGDVKGRQVPMLYVGSVGTGDVQPRLYGIDLDGTTDSQRTIYADQAVVTGTSDADAVLHSGLLSGGGFVSSPALVVNSTTVAGSGNGGALFITETDNTLHQFDATPQSNDTSATSTATGPDFGDYSVFRTAGPYSSPAVASFNVADLNGTGGTAADIDWVYFGDSTTGQLIGVTPGNQNFGTGGGFGDNPSGGGTGIDIPPPINLPQFPLHVYLFPTTQSTSTNLTNAAVIGGSIPAYEWGESVYIRVANVVPPDTTHPIVLDSTATVSTGTPGAAGSYYIVNGSPVSIQISETNRLGIVDANRGSDIGQVPAVLLPSLAPAPPGNGIVQQIKGTDAIEPNGLKDNAGNTYLGAYTYAVGNGSGRKNTPGSQRRIITATQTAQVFQQVGATPNPATDKFISTVTLSATVSPAGKGHTQTVGGVKKRVYQAAVDQPTFAILNPLALSAKGTPIASISTSNAAQQLGYTLGPFRSITAGGPTNTVDAFGFDAAAYSNGNRIYQNVGDLPKNGVLAGAKAATTAPVRINEQVLTTTDLINHGGTGANTDANGNPLVSVADRSALGVIGQSLRLTMRGVPMSWNDNSTNSGEPVYGVGSVINPLPWEDTPIAAAAGTNHSLDYPDIASHAVRQTLQTTNYGSPVITNAGGTADPATGATAAARAVTTDNVKVQISVPRFQPANTQLYAVPAGSTTGTPIAPRITAPSNGNYNFPMGYTAQMRVFVDSDNNHQYTPGEAYRDLTVYTGVPIDMGTQITNGTIDLGVLTQGHGVQTSTSALGPYDPYNATFQTYFKQVTVLNTGNVNLLNVLFDQQLNFSNGAGGNSALPFGAGPLDGNAILPAFDFAGVTGATAAGPVQPYILRTSLDPNFYAVAGKDPRNPAILASTLFGAKAGATFHKARPGDAGPTALTVPDVPHDSSNAAFVPSGTVPTAGTANPSSPSVATPPFLSLEVPIGTPVGTYSQNVRLFEGLASFDGFAGPQYDPTVAGSYGGVVAPTTLPTALTFNNGTATQPYSSAAVVKATVTEVRDTDGASAGTLPHIDTTSATPRADFGPVAFRNLFWTAGGTTNAASGGNIDLYWTSARNASATTPAYNVFGENLPFTVTTDTTVTPNKNYGFFNAGASPTTWYQAIGTLPFATNTGLNTNVSVAQEQHVLNGTTFSSSGNAYLFVQNTAAVAGATGVPNYENRIYCLQINPVTGQLTDTMPTAAAAPRFNNTTDVGANLLASSDPKQAKFGVKGLKIAIGTSFADPLGGAAIQRDLWAFWGEGSRGRAAIGYTSDTTGTNGVVNDDWTPTATLPLPQGIASASDPSAVLIDAPDQKPGVNFGNDVQALDISYTGIGADGNADVYVSRYRPYLIRSAAGAVTSTVGLALSPFPAITESLEADAQGLYWQARDTAWVRDPSTLDVAVNGTSLALVGKTPQFDRASGTLVYTGVTAGPPLTYPTVGTTTIKGVVDTVYVDLVRGRVRFRVTQTLTSGMTVTKRTTSTLPTDAVATATFAPQARRITTDPRADTEPVSFMDEAFQPNLSGLGRVQANRAWYIWRKSGSAGTSTQPTLYYKTQRLTVVLTDGNGKPVSILLNAAGNPQVDVSLGGTPLYARGTGGIADVDWARGRIYLPLTVGGKALEGQTITVTGKDANGNNLVVANGGKAYWLDEPRYNDIKNLPTGTEAASTSETAVPMSTAVNEGTACAFLDPMAFADVSAGAYDPLGNNTGTNNADQPHKVWLYWSSTRNGTADIYSQAIEPRFAPLVTANTVP